MPKALDLSGQTFCRLLVLGLNGRTQQGKTTWSCICSCGSTVIVIGSKLLTGHTRSCGCLVSETTRKNRMSHGKSESRTYAAWCNMKQRCLNRSNNHYRYYGGRGIQICERWKNSFESFLADMGQRPIGLTLDRINNDGNYEPGNCRWTDTFTQARNTRKNRIITMNGHTKTLSQWAEETGLNGGLISRRLKRGWPVELALTLRWHCRYL